MVTFFSGTETNRGVSKRLTCCQPTTAAYNWSWSNQKQPRANSPCIATSGLIDPIGAKGIIKKWNAQLADSMQHGGQSWEILQFFGGGNHGRLAD
jgi:hypothetical protein